MQQIRLFLLLSHIYMQQISNMISFSCSIISVFLPLPAFSSVLSRLQMPAQSDHQGLLLQGRPGMEVLSVVTMFCR
jgi:hypothetical protein